MIPSDGLKRQLDGVVDSIPPDKGCKVLDGEFTHEQRDKQNSESFADYDDTHIC